MAIFAIVPETMKVRFLPVFFALLMAGLELSSMSAVAQDKGLSPNESPDPNHGESSLSDDKGLPYDHEGKTKSSSRDSAAIYSKTSLLTPHATKSKAADHKPSTAKEEDDALSFNFLYYIIQRFKFSDLIDQ